MKLLALKNVSILRLAIIRLLALLTCCFEILTMVN